ncbi:MAG: hypothetical protein JO265_15585 [Acidimicrobiia bacterium]|nr:hypothetical protein [Acidimicrobiia bacterium]
MRKDRRSRGPVRGVAAMVCAALCLTGTVAAVSGRADAASAPPPANLMLQVSSLAPAYPPSTLARWMKEVCATTTAGRSLVLQDVATSDGVLQTSYLDVLAPYLPGGNKACFSHAYVGSVEPQWSGSGSLYVDGVQDAQFRQSYVNASSTVDRAFATRYPTLKVDWYLTYESNLNDFYYPQVEQGYAALLGAEMTALSAIRPHRAFLWSPAFWFPYSSYKSNTAGMAGLTGGLSNLFAAVGPSLQVLDLQDFVAGSACQPSGNQMTPADVVGWIGFLRGVAKAPAVQVNTEQYRLDCATGGVTAGSPVDVASRESYYRSQGLTLGPAFELRYWLSTHGLAT